MPRLRPPTASGRRADTSTTESEAASPAAGQPPKSAPSSGSRGPQSSSSSRAQTAGASSSSGRSSARANIKVAVRCRPFSANEMPGSSEAPTPILKFPSATTLRLRQSKSKGAKTYTFDRVFGPSTEQDEVYESLVAPIVDEALQGYNCTIFAYGQTGTGKTHTMEGTLDPTSADAGIIPRTITSIFETLKASAAEHSVRVSYLEIYNEELHDLLGLTQPPPPLRIFEDKSSGPGSTISVHNLEEVPVSSAADIFPILERGQAKRQVAATKMNAASSRSHAIFSITVHIKESNAEGEDLLKVGKLNLVDLAGSENIGRSGAQSKRAREAGLINQSLLTLGRVINALIERRPHIPYRESKLTRILQDSLGGTTKTCVIATVSPSDLNFEETLSTLDYASRAKTIINTPVANQRMTKRVVITQYIREIEHLNAQLQAAREASGVYLPLDQYTALNERIADLEADLEAATTAVADGAVKLEAMADTLAAATSKLHKVEADLATALENLAHTAASLEHTKVELAETETALADESAWSRVLAAHGHHLVERGDAVRSTLLASLDDLSGTHTKISAYATNAAANATTLDSFSASVAASVADFSSSVDAVSATADSAFASLAASVSALSASAASAASAATSAFDATADAAATASASTASALADLTTVLADTTGAAATAADDAGSAVAAKLNAIATELAGSSETLVATVAAERAAHAAAMEAHNALIASLASGLATFSASLSTSLGCVATDAGAAFAALRADVAAANNAVAAMESEVAATATAHSDALMAALTALVADQTSAMTALVSSHAATVAGAVDTVDAAAAAAGELVDARVGGVADEAADGVAELAALVGDDAVDAAAAAAEAAAEAAADVDAAIRGVDEGVTDGIDGARSVLGDRVETVKAAVAAAADAVGDAAAEAAGVVEAGAGEVDAAAAAGKGGVEAWWGAEDGRAGFAALAGGVEAAESVWGDGAAVVDAFAARVAADVDALAWTDVAVTGATPVKRNEWGVGGPMTPMPVRAGDADHVDVVDADDADEAAQEAAGDDADAVAGDDDDAESGSDDASEAGECGGSDDGGKERTVRPALAEKDLNSPVRRSRRSARA